MARVDEVLESLEIDPIRDCTVGDEWRTTQACQYCHGNGCETKLVVFG